MIVMIASYKTLIVCLLASAVAHATPVNNAQAGSCKLLPGDSAWPTDQEWQQLNAQVQGRLLRSIPLATDCHAPHYNESVCSDLRDTWQVPQTYFSHPTEPMNPTTQGISCDPYSSSNTTCELGNLASYAINVTTAAHVKAGLHFAQVHNLRLSIKNTGHDYLGKSSGKGSLGLWMHHLKDIDVLANYTSPSYTGPAMRLGAGVQAYEAYDVAAAHNLRIVGGDCPTVGLTGGYTQGGGHGPLSTEYGMASDQVLEWNLVDPSGRQVTATPETNSDLYWALSGGGAGTFGVVMSMVVRVYHDGPVGGASLTFMRGNQTETYWDMVRTFYTMAPALVNAGTSLATYFTTDSWTLQAMTKASGNTSVEGMSALIQPFTSALNASGLSYSVSSTSDLTYHAHVSRYLGPLPYGIYNSSSVVAGRLVPLGVVEDRSIDLIDAFRFIAEAGYELNVLAQNVSLSLHSGFTTPNAVLPAWRDSIFHVVVASYWNYFKTEVQNVAVLNELTNEVMPRLYNVTPDSGAYMNEADFQYPDGQWEAAFYGTNFDRLNQIKQKVDPAKIMYANRAVGSQEWTVTSEGRLCRK